VEHNELLFVPASSISN